MESYWQALRTLHQELNEFDQYYLDVASPHKMKCLQKHEVCLLTFY